MRTYFKLDNVLGGIYTRGDLVFGQDGYSLIAPVGNRLAFYDVRNERARVLPVEAKKDILHVALAPNARELLLVTESNQGLYVSLVGGVVLHRHAFNRPVARVLFSPDGKRLCVALRDGDIHFYEVSAATLETYNPMVLMHIHHLGGNFIDASFSADSQLLAVCASDGVTKVIAAVRDNYRNVHNVRVAGHTSAVRNVFFATSNSYELLTLDARAHLVRWQSSITADELVAQKSNKKVKPMLYHKVYKCLLLDEETRANAGRSLTLTAATYKIVTSRAVSLLATAYDNCTVLLHELDNIVENEPVLLQSVSLGGVSADGRAINTMVLSCDGEWLALGGEGRLLAVWEWRSETFAFKQQGHRHPPSAVAVSPDAHHIASGSTDASVKIWLVSSGQCVKTFNEHSAAVTDVCWTQAGRALLSASLDGTVRAFDIFRGINFRTLVVDRPAQFSCVCVDAHAEFVVAGAKDNFEMFCWALNTGQLLNTISGHTAPVSRVAFHPFSAEMASTSWDKTVRTTNVVTSEIHNSDLSADGSLVHFLHKQESVPCAGLDCQYAPDGRTLAVLSADCRVSLFSSDGLTALGDIDARYDLRGGRRHDDVITAEKSKKAKSFTTMSFSPDGDCLLLAGESTTINLYSVKYKTLLTTFTVTINRSLEAVSADLDWVRIRRERASGATISDSEDSDANTQPTGGGRKKRKLPGVAQGDLSKRSTRPEVRVERVHFSPTGTFWVAAACDGVLLYANRTDETTFAPTELTVDATPSSVQQALANGDHATSIQHALALNDTQLIRQAIHAAACVDEVTNDANDPLQPPGSLAAICDQLAMSKVLQLLEWFTVQLMNDTRHAHLYVSCVQRLLLTHGAVLKQRTSGGDAAVTATIVGVIQAVQHVHAALAKIANENHYALEFIRAQSQLAALKIEKA